MAAWVLSKPMALSVSFMASLGFIKPWSTCISRSLCSQSKRCGHFILADPEIVREFFETSDVRNELRDCGLAFFLYREQKTRSFQGIPKVNMITKKTLSLSRST